MILFIVSEMMLFLGFFWAFGHSSLTPTIELAGVWPPRVAVMDPF
jgi:cytochrome c oxidase subunit 3